MSSRRLTIVITPLPHPFGTKCWLTVITAMKTERGMALQDLIAGTYEFIEGLDLKPNARIYLLDHLATTE